MAKQMNQTTETTSVAERPTTEVAAPSYMAGAKSSLTTGTIGTGDIVVPRTKICQPLSREKENMGLKDGDWYNHATGDDYGKELSFFILVRYSSRIWLEKGTQKLLALETDELKVVDGRLTKVGQVRFGKDAERMIKDHYEDGCDCDNYVIVTESAAATSLATRQLPDYAISTHMRAARKYTKPLNLKLKSNGNKGIPIFGQLVHAVNVKESFPQGDAWMPTFSYPRLASEKEFGMLDEFFPIAVELTRREGTVEAAIE